MLKIILLFLISFQVHSQVASGDVLKSEEYNNSVFRIGDVKTSILPLAQFQSLHGSCWIQLNQNISDIDISGSDLASTLGSNSIKSSYGRVLRSEGTNSASLGQQQEDAFQGHGHTFHWATAAALDGSDYSGDSRSASTNLNSDSAIGEAVSDGVNGTPRIANETRMKNLTVNTFIKINNSCL